MNRMRSNSRGFTLIEMLAVLAIVGILTGVVIASIFSARQNSRDGQRIGDISQIRLALEHYYDACGQYPQTLSSTESNGCTGSTNFGLFLGGVSTNDPNGDPYYYFPIGQSGVCYSYHVGAELERNDHPQLTSNHDVDYNPSPAPTDCAGSDLWTFHDDPWYDGVPGR